MFELELLPMMVALHVWGAELKYCQEFLMDNEIAKRALISGFTPSKNGRRLIDPVLSIKCSVS